MKGHLHFDCTTDPPTIAADASGSVSSDDETIKAALLRLIRKDPQIVQTIAESLRRQARLNPFLLPPLGL